MNTKILAWIARAKVVLSFATTHAVAGASFAAILTRLQALITEADALGLHQVDATTMQHAAVERRILLRRNTIVELLRRLVVAVATAAVDHPDLANLLPKLRVNIGSGPFLLLAKSMLAAAVTHKDVLIATGAGETLFDDLQAAITQFEAETETAETGRVGHAGAVRQLPELAKSMNREVKYIGAHMRMAYANDPEMLAAWKAARKVPRHKQAAAEPAPVVGPEPIPAAVPATAPVSGVSPSNGKKLIL